MDRFAAQNYSVLLIAWQILQHSEKQILIHCFFESKLLFSSCFLAFILTDYWFLQIEHKGWCLEGISFNITPLQLEVKRCLFLKVHFLKFRGFILIKLYISNIASYIYTPLLIFFFIPDNKLLSNKPYAILIISFSEYSS